jgi:opacity protein-like surface antigen
MLIWPGLVLGGPLAKPKNNADVWYGNGETTAFKRAMSGSESLTEAEAARIKAMVPPKDYNRFYIRYNVALGRKNLSGITNLSDGSYPQNSAKVSQPAVRDNQRNSLLAVGYDWNPFRFDLEYVWTKSFTYSANPVFEPPAPSMSLNASISNRVLLGNFYWDYRNFSDHIYPYVLISAGGVYNTVKTVLTNPQAGRGLTPTTHNYSWALGAGGGIRLGVTRSLYFDVHFRYLQAGHINFRPEPAMYLRGNHSFYWYGIGLVYLL